MAKKTVIFSYFCDVVEEGGFTEGKCNSCKVKIRGVTSNFVTHIKVR